MLTIPQFTDKNRKLLDKSYVTMRAWLKTDFDKIENVNPNTLLKRGSRIYILDEEALLKFYGLKK